MLCLGIHAGTRMHHCQQQPESREWTLQVCRLVWQGRGIFIKVGGLTKAGFSKEYRVSSLVSASGGSWVLYAVPSVSTAGRSIHPPAFHPPLHSSTCLSSPPPCTHALRPLTTRTPLPPCRVDNERVVTNRPLAGTRRRGVTPEADLALEKELLADEKEV